MWFLKNSAGEVIYLLPGGEITVGRKQADILLHDDASISRLHATFIIQKRQTPTSNANDPVFTCTLTDKGSKYGTYVTNGNKINKIVGQSCILRNGDQIKFGLQTHIFSILYTPMITMASSLHNHEINKLTKIVNQMGGLFCDTFNANCTHLTVSGGVLTQKVVWAIASCIPVVTMEYWDAVQQAVLRKTKLPKPDEYTPVPGDNINKEKVSYVPNELRKSLFRQKIFVHFNAAQFKEYRKIICLAGGKSVLYNMEEHNIEDFYAKNIIVLQYPISDVTQSTIEITPDYNTIYEYLKKRNRRMIPESEIALALLHCSTEKFCNPAFGFSNILTRVKSIQMETCDTLACDTQDLLPVKNASHASKVSVNSKHFIPETNDFSLREETGEHQKPRQQSDKTFSTHKNNCNPNVGGSSLHSQKIAIIIKETQEFNSDHSDDITEVEVHNNRVMVENILAKPGPSNCVQGKTGSPLNISLTNKDEKVSEKVAEKDEKAGSKIVENDNNKTDVKQLLKPIIIDESDDSSWDDGVWLTDSYNRKNNYSKQRKRINVPESNENKLSSENDSESKSEIPVRPEHVFKHRIEKRWISAAKYQVNLNEPHPLEVVVPIKLRDPSEIGKTFKKQEVDIPANRIKFEDLIEASWD